MPSLDNLVQNFLAQKKIAIVGISDKRETGCNMAYERFKAAGYTVYPINPRLSQYQGATCYPNLSAIPEKPDAIFILANPKVTDEIVEEAISLGVKHLWMHCMMGVKAGLGQGTTSVSPKAVQRCRENGIEVIAGSCPNQFLNPDFAHNIMRHLFRFMGYHKLEQA